MSSAHNKFISDEQAIPIVETGIFNGDPDAKLAVVRLEPEDVLTGNDPIAHGYSQFRANVYIDQTGMLDPKHRRPDGGESDSDDIRSYHLAGVENLGNGLAAIIASMRLIRKTEEYPAVLPIEEFFEGELDDIAAGSGSFEVSRWIARARDSDRRTQLLTRLAVTNTGLAHAVRHNWGPCLAVVEPAVARTINRSTGAAARQIAPPRLVEKYNDTNMGIEVDLGMFARHVGQEALNSLYITESGVPNVFWRHSDEQR